MWLLASVMKMSFSVKERWFRAYPTDALEFVHNLYSVQVLEDLHNNTIEVLAKGFELIEALNRSE